MASIACTPPVPAPGEAAGLRERARGALLGLAVGDALGAPAENLRPSEIRARWGRITGYVSEQPCGTDDTEYAIFSGLLLARHGSALTPAHVEAAWHEWIADRAEGPFRGAGFSERGTLENLRRGLVAPISAQHRHAWSDGLAMRAAPFGVFAAGRPSEAARLVAIDGSVSHEGEGIYGGQAVAAGVAAAMTGASVPVVIAAALAVVPDDSWTARSLRRAVAVAHRGERAVRSAVVIGGYPWTDLAPEAVALAFGAYAAADGDFREAVLTAVNMGRDADTTAAVAGALSGATQGLSAIPSPWATAITPARGHCLPSVAGHHVLEVAELLVVGGAGAGVEATGVPPTVLPAVVAPVAMPNEATPPGLPPGAAPAEATPTGLPPGATPTGVTLTGLPPGAAPAEAALTGLPPGSTLAEATLTELPPGTTPTEATLTELPPGTTPTEATLTELPPGSAPAEVTLTGPPSKAAPDGVTPAGAVPDGAMPRVPPVAATHNSTPADALPKAATDDVTLTGPPSKAAPDGVTPAGAVPDGAMPRVPPVAATHNSTPADAPPKAATDDVTLTGPPPKAAPDDVTPAGAVPDGAMPRVPPVAATHNSTPADALPKAATDDVTLTGPPPKAAPDDVTPAGAVPDGAMPRVPPVAATHNSTPADALPKAATDDVTLTGLPPKAATDEVTLTALPPKAAPDDVTPAGVLPGPVPDGPARAGLPGPGPDGERLLPPATSQLTEPLPPSPSASQPTESGGGWAGERGSRGRSPLVGAGNAGQGDSEGRA